MTRMRGIFGVDRVRGDAMHPLKNATSSNKMRTLDVSERDEDSAGRDRRV
ncbi:MAG: hypothetical protein H6832_06155 [Planctomycetes bacterium]|nr:hypothetical protein [Planctomycetota bacterium]MCB9917968.1 hypothetical protein [Planctomycetota bacterium]